MMYMPPALDLTLAHAAVHVSVAGRPSNRAENLAVAFPTHNAIDPIFAMIPIAALEPSKFQPKIKFKKKSNKKFIRTKSSRLHSTKSRANPKRNVTEQKIKLIERKKHKQLINVWCLLNVCKRYTFSNNICLVHTSFRFHYITITFSANISFIESFFFSSSVE